MSIVNKAFKPGFGILLIIFALSNILSGCLSSVSSYPNLSTKGTYPVDPLFREVFDYLGGQEMLGPAISPLFQSDNIKYQYIASILLLYNPQAGMEERFQLSPLGKELNITEFPVPPPQDPGILFINGHSVYQEFVPLFEKLGGTKTVGNPITEVRYNLEQNRIEQFFEKAGFYRLISDPTSPVRLLSLGSWMCGSSCQYQPAVESRIMLPQLEDSPFSESLAMLGANFTGYALSETTISFDGKLEQIYENIVVTADPTNPGHIQLRSVPLAIGISIEPPVSMLNQTEGFFYPTQDDLGYNIPEVIWEYISKHGGIEITGTPISELTQQDSNIFRQCFTNICLDYLENEAPALQIRPVPLGYIYKRQMEYNQNQGLQTGHLKPDVNVQIWEAHPTIKIDQDQFIGISITERNKPLSGITVKLNILFPDGTETTYSLAPTNEQGLSYISLPKVVGMNGTIIPYTVCTTNLITDEICVEDDYLIWDLP